MSAILSSEAIQSIPGEKKPERGTPWILTAQPSDFDWILDKNLLRDEGVFYGLSENNEIPAEKIDAIRHFFQERIKVLEKSLDVQRTEAAFCRNEMADSALQIETWRKRIEEVSMTSVAQPHDFWRYALGALVYATMLICNFWLVQSWISTSNLSSPGLVAFGVYLFGSLSLFSRASQLYHSENKLGGEADRRESWKTYLEEWAIPFVVALFVVYQGHAAHSNGESAIFFMLIFSIFLFVGKGFLNTLVLVRTEYGKLAQNQKARRLQREYQRNAYKEMAQQEIEIKQFMEKETAIKLQILEDEKTRALFQEQQETNVSLFLSEFGLAKAMRQSLNHKQLSHLISNRH